MSLAEQVQADAAAPAPAPPPPARRKALVSRQDVIVFLLAANMIGLIGLGVRVYRGDKPTVVTVGITQMARDYMGRVAASNISPEEARIRTQMFLAVVQDTVRTAAARKGMVVMPRECVLGGEFSDITADVSQAVNQAMQHRAAQIPAAPPAAAPAAPIAPQPPGGLDVAP